MDHPWQPHDCNVQLLKKDTLGSGSYGVVFTAVYGQRLCAAKLLHSIFFQSNDPGIATTRRRFEQECQFLNELKHPHIVEYLGTSHDPDSGLLVLLMELCDESLTHFLERSQQPLAYHIEVDLCHDIAQALVYIHSKDIIHRDLSSNNVLLIDGRAKITDFGMSKLLDAHQRMTPLTVCPGTTAYMPPEALSEPPVYSKKIDCFSFGVLQIQIMTRQFPDPGPAMRVVEDSRSPTGTTKMPVLESERRKSHIDHIDPTHTLLPIAVGCLSYSEKERPSAQDLCQQLAAIKEAPHYQLLILRQELQTKDQQLQDKQRCIHALHEELQDSQRVFQDLQDTIGLQKQYLQQAVEEKQASEQEIKQLQATVRQLKSYLQQGMEEKQAHERRLRELEIPQVGAQPHDSITPPKLELQEPQEKQHATGDDQLLATKQPEPLPQEPVLQQKAIQNMRWQKESKAPEKMYRGFAASDSNIAYFNSRHRTSVYSYDSDTREWHRLPDATCTKSALVVVDHVPTMVGGWISRAATNILLSLLGKGSVKIWLPYLPAMPTKRFNTAAVYSGHSLIVAGGEDGRNRLATVEVFDTDTWQWSIANSLSHPFTEATISVCGERLYMLGGYDEEVSRSVLSCSVPELLQSCQPQPPAGELSTTPAKQSTRAMLWQHVADVPQYWSSCAIFCGQLVAVGGYEADKNTSAIFGFNKTTGSWEAMGNMLTARRQALVAIFNRKMMVVGGKIGGRIGGRWSETDEVEVLC